jgi:transposase
VIVELCKAFGVQLEFLLLYSPDYNPIEKSFKVLKSWIKKHADEQQHWELFSNYMELAVRRSCYNIDCRSWYRKCGLPCTDDD